MTEHEPDICKTAMKHDLRACCTDSANEINVEAECSDFDVDISRSRQELELVLAVPYSGVSLKNTSSCEQFSAREALPDDFAIAGRFEILGTLGSGGAATVFKALDRQTNNVVAIKILNCRLDISDRVRLRRFEKEVESSSGLSHENIVAIFDHGRADDGSAFIVMELIEGETLASRLKGAEPLSASDFFEIFGEICSALEHAHGNGILHRDIKPSNVMLRCAGQESKVVKLLDFGIAESLASRYSEESTLTGTAEIVGSPRYMSPEQCRGEELDERSDIYSLGCLMYEALSGKPPFSGNNPVQIILKQISDQPEPLNSSIVLDRRLYFAERIMMRCLAKSPEERYKSVAELIVDLNRASRDKPPLFASSNDSRSILMLAFSAMTASMISFSLAAMLFLPIGYSAATKKERAGQFNAKPELTRQKPVNRAIAKRLNKLAFKHYKEGSYSQALPLLGYLVETARKEGNRAQEAFCFRCMGECYTAQGNNKKALQSYKVAVKIFDSLPERASTALMSAETKSTYIQLLRRAGHTEEARRMQMSLNKRDLANLVRFYEDVGLAESAASIKATIGQL